jgi:hypothetical protein
MLCVFLLSKLLKKPTKSNNQNTIKQIKNVLHIRCQLLLVRDQGAIIREIINNKSGSEGEQRLNYGLELRTSVIGKLSDYGTLVQKQVGVGT